MLIALSGLDRFIEMFEQFRNKNDVVVVSTDAGGAKFAVHYSEAMGVTHAIASKFRRGKDAPDLLGIIGSLEGKTTAIVVDDETVTFSSILNTVESLHKNYHIPNIYAAVSHAKMKKEFLPQLIKAHREFGLKEFHITDTIPQIPEIQKLDFVVIHTLARRFAATINRLHYNQSVRELFYKPLVS
jgi:ribose-phosphate pyrophosphokinase